MVSNSMSVEYMHLALREGRGVSSVQHSAAMGGRGIGKWEGGEQRIVPI